MLFSNDGGATLCKVCETDHSILFFTDHKFLACIAVLSFPFPGGEIERAGERRSAPGVN